MNDDYEPPFVHGEQGERSAQIIHVDSSKHVSAVAVCAAICGIAASLSAWAAYTSIRMEREVRMQQYYLLELDAKVIEAGIKKPDDSLANRLGKKGD